MRKIGKRGEVGIGAAVVIVIAVIVLVIAVIGIMGGFNPLWEKVKNFLGGGANVDTVKQACSLACSTDTTYDYCKLERKVKAKEAVFKNVDKDSGRFSGTGILSKEVTSNCEELAVKAKELGFENCPGIEPCIRECGGTATACTDVQFNTKDLCEAQKVCKFTAASGGDPAKCEADATDGLKPCTDAQFKTKDLCEAQKGCTWT